VHQATMLDCYTPIYYNAEASCVSAHCRSLVYDAKLHPDHIGSDRNRVFHHISHKLRSPKNIDDVNMERHITQAGIRLLAKHRPAQIWIYWDNTVAMPL
jgi:hypothetical protein